MTLNKEYPSTNYWPNNDPRSFMLHTTGGYGVIGAVETLIARGLSYNYIIDNGIVYELVNWENSAWHAGLIRKPNLRSRTFYGSLKDEDNPNRNSVGVAFTYPTGGKLTELPDKDIDACVKLIKMVGREADVRYNADNIFYHQEVTVDKPLMVKGYREQVLDALVGDKDEKDAGEMTHLELTIKYLKLRIEYLLLLISLSKKST